MKVIVPEVSPMDNRSDSSPIPIKRSIGAHFMPRHDAHTERGNEIWLITLSDLLMLLMIFFVVLFSLALQKQYLAKQPTKASAGTPAISQVSDYVKKAASDTPSVAPTQQDIPTSLEKELVSALNSENNPQGLFIRRTADLLTLTFPEKIIFDPGQAKLKSSSDDILNKVAMFINSHANLVVEVQGYTDDTPINSTQYPSNWELSVDRATQVARSLIARGTNPTQVSVKGFGEYHPLVPNRSVEEKQLNRRVEIQFTIPPAAGMPAEQKA
jgi:chemotaxis protein MotB